MQESGLGGVARADHMLEVALWVPGDVLLGKGIARPGDEHSDVDDQTAELRDGGLEPREDGGGRPDVGGQVLREGLLGELGRRGGALEGGLDVEGAVGVVGALEGVDLAVLQGLFAEGPAG